jgi:hypothetical protein
MNTAIPAPRIQEDGRGCLLDAAELGAVLNVTRGWVYEHKAELGVIRLGSGPRARLRFDVLEVRRRLSLCAEGGESQGVDTRVPEPMRTRRPSRSTGASVELLPIRGPVVLEVAEGWPPTHR